MMRKIIYDCQTGNCREEDVVEEFTSFEDLKVLKLVELMQIYKDIITNGFESDATGEKLLYGYKQQDQLNYSKLANTLALDPEKS